MTPSPRVLVCCLAFLLLGITGCGPQFGATNTPAAPTISSFFGTMSVEPTVESTAIASPIPITRPDSTAIANATIVARGEDYLKTVIVYDDALNSDWSLEHSFQSEITMKNRAYVKSGRYSIKVKPLYTTGTLYFTLNKTAKRMFLRSQVQAVRFYLSGGAQPIDNDVLTVAVIGSNAKSYWVEHDVSVQLDGRVTDNMPIFSETRLLYLGINKAIPPKTVVEVTVWLDGLIYDPSYKYVTGFYIKTDKGSVPTFYVDQVSLLLLPDKP